MQVIIAAEAGFCNGVKRAVDMSLRAAERYGKVYTFGNLIHNARVVKELADKNVITIKEPHEAKGGAVIIRTHGISKEDYTVIGNYAKALVDATCPCVKKIHTVCADYSAKGYHIIILGKGEHPEVKGIAGWCDSFTLTDGCTDFILPEKYDKFLVVTQTTFSPYVYARFKENLMQQARNSSKTVEFFNGICYTTVCRQSGAVSVSKKSDAVLVLGDRESSNTTELYDTASKFCKDVYLISNVSDVSSVANIKNIAKLGILAGASTPKELIMEVINRMDQENKVDVIVTDEVKTADVQAEEALVKDEAEAKAAPVVKKEKADSDMTMEEAMKKYSVHPKSYREGMKLKVCIISVDPTGVSVAVDGNMSKNDSGFIEKDEMELDGNYNPESYRPGDILDVVIIPKTDSKSKAINLSKKAYDAIKIEDEAVKKILEGEEFTLACGQAIKGGLLGKIGTYTVFVPASQIRIGYVKNLEDYVGKKLRLRILPPKEEEVISAEEGENTEAAPKRRANPKRIVASQRIILEEEKDAREEAFWEVMQVNNIIKGKVKRFTPFGAFVSIMNFDCLAHISDLSWTKINDPSEVLELNKSYDFVVIKVDRENGKVSLGYKQLQKKPYELAAEKYHVGDVIKGKVERIKDFGAFVALEPGIDGLVHVSEIGHKWIANATEILKVGDEIDAKIIGFENNKITLSMKALIEPPVIEESSEDKEERPSRTAKFSKRAEGADSRGERKDRGGRRFDKDSSDEPREWVSSSGVGATFADLFKGIDINKFDSEGEDK